MKLLDRILRSKQESLQPRANKPTGAPLIMALEPRIMFDAAAVATAVSHDPAPPADTPVDHVQEHAQPPAASAAEQRQEIVFLDQRVPGYASLLPAVRDGVTVVVLDSQSDGLKQIRDYLAQHPGYDSVHIISHGSAGTLELGSAIVNFSSLNNYQGDLQSIGAAINAGGDVLLYGCDVAQGEAGQLFVNTLSTIMGRDVAASTDDTGSAAKGGDWNLELHVGDIYASAVLSAERLQAFQDVLASSTKVFYITAGGAGSTPAATDTLGRVDNDATGNTSIATAVAGNPSSVAIDIANNRAFVSDSFTGINTIFQVNLTTGAVTTFASGLPGVPNDLKYDSSTGSLYAVTAGGAGATPAAADAVIKINSAGTIVSNFGSIVGNASGLALDLANNRAFVSDSFAGVNKIVSVNLSTGAVTDYVTTSNAPSALQMDTINNRLYFLTNGGAGSTPAAQDALAYVNLATTGITTVATAIAGNPTDFVLDLANGRAIVTDSFTGVNKLISVSLSTGAVSDFLTGTTSTPVGIAITDTSVPTFDPVNSSPADNASGIAGSSNIQLRFSEVVYQGTGGSFVIRNVTDNTVVETIPFGDSRVTGWGTNTLTINPSATLAGGKNISVQWSGSSMQDAFGNYVAANSTDTVFNFSTIAPNTAPVVSDLHGDSVNYIEGNSAVLLDASSDTTVGDSDSLDFNGGNMTVSIVTNRVTSEDVLSIRNQGTGAGQIGVSGSNITYGGTTIGSFSGGTGSNDLVITFNSNATAAAAQTLARNLTYSNSNGVDPSTSNRTVRVTINDGDGATSSNNDITVSITRVNDAPTLTATGSNPTFTEDGGSVDLFSGVSIGTVDSGQSIDLITLTVTNVSNGSSETLNIDGSVVTLTNGSSVTSAGNGMTIAVSVAGSTATVNITKVGGISTANAQTLVDGISYNNSSQAPSTANRVVTLTSIRDTGGSSNGGVDTTSLSVSSTVTVASANDAPVVSAPPSISVTEDVATALTGISFSDVDAGSSSVTVTLSVGSGTLAATSGGGVTIGGTASALTLTGSIANINAFIAGSNVTFTTAANGSSNVTLTTSINDGGFTGSGGAQTDSETTTLQVSAVNDAPVITMPGSINITEDVTGAITGISFLDVDAGSGSVTVTLSVPSGTLAAISGGGVTVGGSASALTLTGSIANINTFIAGSNVSFTTAANSTTNVTLTASINDNGNTGSGGALSDSETTTLVVTAVNDAPTVANVIPNQNATEDSAFNFQFAANTFADAEADVLSYSAQLAGGGALPAWLSFDAVTRTFSGTPANGDVGMISIDVTASDGNGGSVTDTFTLTVANTNDAPTVANAIPNQNATEDSAFNFQFAANSFNDIDASDTLSYSVQLAGGGALPAWLSFDSATRTFSGTPAQSDVGMISIDVTASDGNGGSVTDTFTLTVANTNDAPTVANAIPNQNATEDSAFNFQFAANSFNDVDAGDTLSYSAQLAGGGALPAWLSFDALTRTFSGTPANGDVGMISIDVTASDGNGGSVTDTFTLTVANTNDAPTVANLIPNQNATEDSAFNFQFAANSFNDVDASDTLSYSVQLTGGGALPAWLSFDSATRTFSGTPAQSDVGALSIEVTASDGNGGTVTDSFTLSVAASNDAPVVSTTGGTVTFTEEAGGSGGTPVVIDSGITLSDEDNTTLASATVSVTGNSSGTFLGGEDSLGFSNDGSTMGNITGSYDSTTGVLTLSSAGGSATLAQWQAALRSITYSNSSDTPNTDSRVITFTVNDGALSSSNGNRLVNIVAVNDSPVVSYPATIAVTEDQASALSGIVFSDADAGSNPVTVTLSVGSGTLAATSGSGVTVGGTASALTLSGSVADINAFIAASQVSFTTAANSTSTVTLTANINDGGNTGAGGAKTDSESILLQITAVNDTPVVSTPPSITVTEDVATAITGISFSDVDAGSGTVTVTLSVPTGSLAASSGAGVTVGGSGSAALTLSGSVADINAFIAANQVSFTTAANSTGNVTLTASINDGGNTGTGGSLSDSATTTLQVTAVNDAPSISAPPSISVTEEVASPLTGFSFSDVDAGGASISVTLTVGAGTLNANSGGGVTVAGTGTNSLTLSGSRANINAFIAGSQVNYLSVVNPSSNPTLQLSVSDNGNTGSGGSLSANQSLTINIVGVNDAPVATASGGNTAFSEGNNVASTPVAIDSGLTLSDVDNSTLSTATVSITGGFQSGQDLLAFSNDGSTMGNITASYDSTTGVLSLSSAGGSATLAQWQAALRAVTYSNSSDTPNTGNRTISFVVDDGDDSSTAATKTVSVAAVNDTPLASASGGTTSFVEGANMASTPVVIDSGLTLSDVDSSTLTSATVSISGGFQSAEDVLAFVNTANITGSYNSATGVLTLTGTGATVAQMQTALRSVTYSNSSDAPNTGNRSISFVVNDGTSNSSAASKTVTITAANDAPVATTSGGTSSFVEGNNVSSTPVVIDSGLTLSDADSATLSQATVSITGGFQSSEDVLAFANTANITGSYNSATGVLTLTGTGATLAEMQAALRSVTYSNSSDTPNTGNRTISFAVNDGAASSNTANKTVSIAATNDTPIVSGGTGMQPVNDNASIAPFTDITITDADNWVGVIIKLDNDAKGTLINPNPGLGTLSYNSVEARYELVGVPADVQALIQGLIFQPTENRLSPGSTELAGFYIAIGDSVGAVDDDISLVSVLVTSVNDAPTIGGTVVGQSVADNGSLSPFSSATIDDVDNPDQTLTVQIQLSQAGNGGLSNLGGGSYDSATGIYTFSGTASNATTAIRGLVFTPTTNQVQPGATVSTQFTLSVNDGAGGSASNASTTVVAQSVNDAPVIGGSAGTASFVEGQNTASVAVIVDSGFTLSDLDVGSTLHSATVSITGNLQSSQDLLAFMNDGSTMGNITGSYDSTTGVLSLSSAGNSATLAQWQAALRAVSYSNSSDTPNTATRTLSFQVNDGSANSNTHTRDVTVTAINDAPVNSTPAAQNVDQDATLTFSASNGNQISISDMDAGSNNVEVTLTANNGLLTLNGTTGLSFSSGDGINDATLIFSGTVADINAALNGLVFTPTPDYNGPASLTLTTDDQGNTGTGGAQTDSDTIAITVDPINPEILSVGTTASNGSYQIGDVIAITVTFDQVVNVDSSGGTPSLLLETGAVDRAATYVSGSGTNTLTFLYTVQEGDVTADLDYHASAQLELNGATIRNAGNDDAVPTLPTAGGSGSIAGQHDLAIDGIRPTATITVADTALAVGESSTVSITFSEAVTGLTTADFTVANGVLSGLASSDGGITWTATLTPTADVTDASNLITLDNTGVVDAAGNSGTGNTDSTNYAIDTLRPTATITVADTALAVGETSTVTISFSEAVSGLTTADFTVANGVLSGLASSDGGLSWTATLTPTTDTTDASNLITLNNTGVVDAAGNSGTGTTDSNNYAIDTLRPTATIVVADTALIAGESSQVTITFSEAVSGLEIADFTVANGVLSALSSSDGISWTATFTPSVNITDASNIITLDNTAYADAAGNTGTDTTDSNNYAVDTDVPEVLSLSREQAATVLPGSVEFRLVFDQAVNGVDSSDFTVVTTGNAQGTITGLTQLSASEWLISVNVSGEGTVGLNLAASNNVQDDAGNSTAAATGAVYTVQPIVANLLEEAPLPTGNSGGNGSPFVVEPSAPLIVLTALDHYGPPGLGLDRLVTPQPDSSVLASSAARPLQAEERLASGLQAKPSLGQVAVGAGQRLQFNLPTDTFQQAQASAPVVLSARLADGRPLPAWLQFDPRQGRLLGDVPAGLAQTLVIEFQALDERGNQASTTLTLKIQAVAPAGRASLDQQFDRFGQAQHSQQQEQLRQQLQALAQLQQAGADQATTL